MRILIANPPWGDRSVRAGSRWPHTAEISAVYMPFPFFQAHAAAVALERGHDVSVVDALAERLGHEAFMARVCAAGPDVIQMETSTPSINEDYAYADLLKAETGATIVLSGPHATVFPSEAAGHADYVLLGEYERTFAELLDELSSGGEPGTVPGLAYTASGEIRNTGPRPLVEDLDELPVPARHLFPMTDYHDPAVAYPSLQFLASRGCTFKCSFCLWPQVMYEGRFRARDPVRVVDEIEQAVAAYAPRALYFDDDTFTIGKRRVMALCDELANRNLVLPWGCMAHTRTVDEELLEAMHGAGCTLIKYGVESANPGILKQIPKATTTRDVSDALALTKRIGIKTHATFTFGLPGETPETIEETISFAQAIDADSVQFSIVAPFPGTRLYEMAREHGWLMTQDWRAWDGGCRAVMDVGTVQPEKLEEALARAYRRFEQSRSRLGYLGRYLSTARKSGVRYATRLALNKLRRRYGAKVKGG